MRGGAVAGFGMLAIACLLWLPEFTHPLSSGLLLSASVLGFVLAATHWRRAGLVLTVPAFVHFATTFGGIDSVVAGGIAGGLAVAAVGEARRSVGMLAGGLMGAGIVQTYWLLAYFDPRTNPYFWGNALFTAGALLAALSLWRAHPWAHAAPAAPAPETVK